MSYTKNDDKSANYTFFSWTKWCHLFSSLRVIIEPNFNSYNALKLKFMEKHTPSSFEWSSCSTYSPPRYIFQNLLSIHVNWKIAGSNFFGKLKINGNLVVKEVPPCCGFVALRQLNTIHKKGPWSDFFLIKTWNKAYREE